MRRCRAGLPRSFDSFASSLPALTRLVLYDACMNPLRSVLCLAILLFALAAHAEPLTRSDALRIAESFARHQWEASEKNALHGPDRAHIEVNTPDNPAGSADDTGLWKVGVVNVGVPYKWGGFDSIESFDA